MTQRSADAKPPDEEADSGRPPSVAELERRSAELRAQLDRTLDELSLCFTPHHLRHAAALSLRTRARQLGNRMSTTIRRRPGTAAAVTAATGLICGVLLRRWRRGRNAR